MRRKNRKRLGLNQSGHALRTEFMLLIVAVSLGAAFFIPRMHNGIMGALGKALEDVFLFFVGLGVLLIVISILGAIKDFILDRILKFLKGKNPPKPPAKS